MVKTWRLWSAAPVFKETERVLLQRDRIHEGDLILVNRSHPVKMLSPELTPLPSGILQALSAEEPLIQLER
ncbi:MAG: hypothetical protein ACQEV7_23435, partial [Bacillota bacterium]